MSGLFNLDSPVMRFLGRMADLLWLNVLTLFLFILVIPAGAALTALNYMCLKIVRGEDCYITKGYFKSFRENFKQATLIWLIVLVVLAILYGDYRILTQSGMQFPMAFKLILMAVTLLLGLVLMYVFPVLSRYENTIRNTFKNAAVMALVSLPKTLLMLVIWCLPVATVLISERLIPFVLFFGISVPTLLCAYLYNGTFKKFEPAVEADPQKNADPDRWHVYKEGEEAQDKADKESIRREIQENLEEIGESGTAEEEE